VPIYNYKCPKCDKKVEVFTQSISEEKPKCEECGVEMERDYSSAFGLKFKGNGYYVTDK
jgi:putative FmdB family regulatory protein